MKKALKREMVHFKLIVQIVRNRPQYQLVVKENKVYECTAGHLGVIY